MSHISRPSGRIKTSLPIDRSDDRIVLYSWATSQEPRFQNVARVDKEGIVIWRAELPGSVAHDCFVSLKYDGAVYAAQTYSGLTARIDPDGSLLSAIDFGS